MNDVNNLELGPTENFFGTAGGELTLGFTSGGTTINVEDDRTDLVADQLGTSPADQAITGRGATVEMELAETTLENLLIVLPGARLVVDSGDPTKKKLVLRNPVGTQMVKDGFAKSLLIKKFVGGAASSDPQDFIRFFLAAPTGALSLPFNVADQRTYAVTFQCFPDTSNSDRALGVFGDESAAS